MSHPGGAKDHTPKTYSERAKALLTVIRLGPLTTEKVGDLLGVDRLRARYLLYTLEFEGNIGRERLNGRTVWRVVRR